ncbi:MAG: lyase family protein, partial [Gemmobacter sp.]
MNNAFVGNGLFGSLFGDAATASAFGASQVLGRMIAFETAWTRALIAAGIVEEADGALALGAIGAFHAGSFSGAASDVDGVPVPSLVAALRAGLPPGAARAIHTGATSQDVIDTAMVLCCLTVLDDFDARLGGLDLALGGLERRVGAAPLMARTRMQAALPATAALRLGAWRRLVQAQRDRARALRADLARVQVGGAIGLRDLPDGKGEAVAAAVAQALGLGVTAVWHADRSAMVGLGHWFTLVAGAMGKIGQDVALMAQQGVDEITLAGGGGSSAMAHKQNPILAETMVALARHVAGLQGTLAQAMIHEQERSGA